MPHNMEKSILVVEDEETLGRALVFKLGSAGFMVDYAQNGMEALKFVEEGRYDLILLDFVMPVMDGFTFLREIREKKITTPVIGLSNLGQEEDLAKAAELGVVKYLTKSASPINEIVEAVEQALGVS